jgi:hypothetical protein
MPEKVVRRGLIIVMAQSTPYSHPDRRTTLGAALIERAAFWYQVLVLKSVFWRMVLRLRTLLETDRFTTRLARRILATAALPLNEHHD